MGSRNEYPGYRYARNAKLLLCIIVLMCSGITAVFAAGNQSGAPAAMANPKAYIGLFKDNAIAVFDTMTNRLLTTIAIPAGPHGLVLSPDGRLLYASSDGDSKVSVVDTGSDTVVKSIEVGKAPHGLAISADGSVLMVAGFGTSTVMFVDTGSNNITGSVAVPNPHNIALSPDGKRAYVASQMAGAFGLAVVDLVKRTVVRTIKLDKSPRALNFSPDGKLLYFTLAGSDSVQVLDVATDGVVSAVPVGASPHHPILTKDGSSLLVVSQGPGSLYFINPSNNTVQTSIKVGTLPHWIGLSGDNKTAFVSNEGSGDLSVINLETKTITTTVALGNGPRKIVVQQKPANTSATSNNNHAPLNMQTVIANYAFASNIKVSVGQAVTWVNKDSVPHTVTSDTGLWDSGDLAAGQSYTLTLSKAGNYAYHCAMHPYMTGTITVVN